MSALFSSKTAADHVETCGLYDTPIEYGWCWTDLKSNQARNRTLNFTSEQNVASIKTLLTSVGLPWPEKAFYPGTDYDLLFLRSHGIVAKVGQNHDPLDLIHPAIIQPIGWVTDETSALNLSIYAGEKIPKSKRWGDEQVEPALWKTGQGCADAFTASNNVYVDSVQLLIDCCAKGNATKDPTIRAKKESLSSKKWNRTGVNNAQSHREIMHELYGEEPLLQPYLPLFDRHQLLRELFWNAQQVAIDGFPEPQRLKEFWDTCCEWTKSPNEDGTQLYRDYLNQPAP